jgi:hypothetical protein
MLLEHALSHPQRPGAAVSFALGPLNHLRASLNSIEKKEKKEKK